jgi:DNA-binding CsgD family transcriptional regulator
MQFISSAEFQRRDAQLTPRQREVLLQFLLGADDKDIAQQLYVAQDTIRRHLSDICKLFNPNEGQSFQRSQLMVHYARYRPELFRDSLLLKQTDLDLVLSYQQDSPLEQKVTQSLTQTVAEIMPHRFWIDKNLRMTPGGRKQIQVALRSTKALLVLLSPTSDEETITEEVKIATSHRPSEHSFKLIVAYLDRPQESANHELRHYLKIAHQLSWHSSTEMTNLTTAIVDYLQDQAQSPSAIAPAPTIELHDTVWPPSPSAEPELPTGTVNLSSAFYIERPGVDDRCYEEIHKPSALIRIKAPRQMGKTSLLARVLNQASQWGCKTVVLSFHLAEASRFASLDTFLFWFCANISHTLDLAIAPLKEYWQQKDILGTKTVCTGYIEEYILSAISEKLVLGLDEVDVVFEYQHIASDFFGLLRAWHEQSKTSELWQKLSLVVVHSTEVYVSLPTTQSPFNVGLPIDLPEFDASRVQELAIRHGLNWQDAEVQALMELVGGHPYLVRLALYHIARAETSLPQLLADAPTDAGLYSDHLRRCFCLLSRFLNINL